MGRIPASLRRIIGDNIHACRVEKHPERGGAKKCAEALGVSPQQWSPWERGFRTPDELHLERIAAYFGKTVEYMRRDNRQPEPDARSGGAASRFARVSGESNPRRDDAGEAASAEAPDVPSYICMSTPELLAAMHRDKIKLVYQVEVTVTSVRLARRSEADGD